MASFFRISIFLTILILTSSAKAEYYVVYSAPPCGYASCYEPPHRVYHAKKHTYTKHVHKHKSVRHKYINRREYYNECRSGEYYAWVPVPVCSCNYYAAPGCGCGGRWVPVKRDYSKDYTFTTPDDKAYYDYQYHYDPDLSTGDDDATVDPNMDIDH